MAGVLYIYPVIPAIIIALKFELIISTMATSVDGGVAGFPFQRPIITTSITAIQFQNQPRIFEATAKSQVSQWSRDI